jgi:hypothetical protein
MRSEKEQRERDLRDARRVFSRIMTFQVQLLTDEDMERRVRERRSM